MSSDMSLMINMLTTKVRRINIGVKLDFMNVLNATSGLVLILHGQFSSFAGKVVPVVSGENCARFMAEIQTAFSLGSLL